jgi:HlyD family secretion protein
VNEADVGRVKAGQPVTFTVDAYPGQTFEGNVAVVQPLGTPVNNVVTYTVTVDINPPSVQLLPGMTANVTILTTSVPNALVVPSSAISFAQSQGGAAGSPSSAPPKPAAPAGEPASATHAPTLATVIVETDGKGSPRQIQTGASDDRNTQVLSGLSPGEHVAVGTAQR